MPAQGIGNVIRLLMQQAANAQQQKRGAQDEVMQLMQKGFQPRAGTPFSAEGMADREAAQGTGISKILRQVFQPGPRPNAANFEPSSIHPQVAATDRVQLNIDATATENQKDRDLEREEKKKDRELTREQRDADRQTQLTLQDKEDAAAMARARVKADDKLRKDLIAAQKALDVEAAKLRRAMLRTPKDQLDAADLIDRLNKMKEDYVERALGAWDYIVPDLFGTREGWAEWFLTTFSDEAKRTVDRLNETIIEEYKTIHGQAAFGADIFGGGSEQSRFEAEADDAFARDDLDDVAYPRHQYGELPSSGQLGPGSVKPPGTNTAQSIDPAIDVRSIIDAFARMAQHRGGRSAQREEEYRRRYGN